MWRYGPLPGLIAGTVSLLGWAWALFGPTVRYSSMETSTGVGPDRVVTDSGWTSLRDSQDFETITVVFLMIMLASAIGLLIGAILHGRFHTAAGRALLWLGAVTLLGGSILSAFSIGYLLLPGAILAVVAAVLASSTPQHNDSQTA